MKSEQEILDYWEKNSIFERSQTKGGRPFIFYEGPPTANGQPGLHHVLARAYKDVVLRYRAMAGDQVKRRAGWDTHGLPVELQVEKQLGISGKKDIENIVPGDKRASIIKFNQLCKESVWRYKKDWEDLTAKIGFWLDLKDPYITYENSYIEKLWGIIKQIHAKGLLVKSEKIVPYCPRCETTLSSHELAQGYKDIKDPSLFVLLKLVERREYLLVWTTTPWTLPGNLAVAVSGDENYGLYRVDDKKIWLAQRRAIALNITSGPKKTVSGKEMAGWKYQPLYPSKSVNRKCYQIYLGDFVSLEEGTGLVHIAPGFGEDDYNLGNKIGLPALVTISSTGRVSADVPGKGKFFKDADPDIVADLQRRGLVYKAGSIVHSYPFCWRCDAPVIYIARAAWFILMSRLRQELIAQNQKISWIPEHIKNGRFGKWLTEVKDWAFSRERYWGTPLPIWTCQIGKIKNQSASRRTKTNTIKSCGNVEVIGGIAELKSKLSTINHQLSTDLHRPYIDEITWRCEKCQKGEMVREPYVCDVWFDSGAMPFASGEFDSGRYPADYICEAVDQTRGWFYTLLAIGVLMSRGAPYKKVISLSHVLDEKGQKMSKSKGNIVDPWKMLERYGADSLRLYLYSANQPGDNKLFSEKDLATMERKSILLLKNIIQFLNSYQKLDKVDLARMKKVAPKALLNVWLNERTKELVNSVEGKMRRFDITASCRAAIEFINDLSTWYLRRSRKNRTREFYSTIVAALKTLSLVLAPFAPFISEAINLELGENESVHLKNFPERLDYNKDILEKMRELRTIVAHVLARRAKVKIKVRQPLSSLMLSGYKISSEEVEIIKDEINVEKVIIKAGKKSIRLDTKITPALKAEGQIREIIRLIQDARKAAGLEFSQKAKVAIESDLPADWIEKYQLRIEKETITKMVKNIVDIKSVIENNSVKVTIGQ